MRTDHLLLQLDKFLALPLKCFVVNRHLSSAIVIFVIIIVFIL